MRAKVVRRGGLAFVETELGQKAVVPWDALCDIILRYGLNVEVEGGEPPKCVSSKKLPVEEVNVEVELPEEPEEDEG